MKAWEHNCFSSPRCICFHWTALYSSHFSHPACHNSEPGTQTSHWGVALWAPSNAAKFQRIKMHSVSTFTKLWARLNGNFDPPVRRYKLFCWERLMLCSNIFSWTPLNVNQSPGAAVGRLVIRWGGTHWFLILTCKFVCHPICTVSWPACILLSTSLHHGILCFKVSD